MIRVIQVLVVAILIFLAIRVVRLVMKFGSGSRPNIDNLKDRASNLKNKFKDVEEADFREIPPDEERKSSEKDNG